MTRRPEWLVLGEDLFNPVIAASLAATRRLVFANPQVEPLPYMAVCHLASCLETSIDANKQGRHSVAICLVRQCLEAFTIIDIGLQDSTYAEPLLLAWSEGKKTAGQLRQNLERDIWPSYGKGLWHESWTEYFGNLAQSVHPYAHYSPELQGWQWVTIKSGNRSAFMTTGPNTYDELKAARTTLLHILLIWTAGRLILAHDKELLGLEDRARVLKLGSAIKSTNLLFEEENWGLQLIPHMFFKEGHDWRQGI